MDEWQQVLRRSITTVDELVERFGEENIDREAAQRAIENFNLRITPAAAEFLKEKGDRFWNQYVPTPEELNVEDGIVDALAEDEDSPVPNLTHRYPDRALFLVSPVCATYCRFCTRRRKVGDPEKIPLNQFAAAFDYLREHTEVRDVILSGGDPFMLSDRRIEYFLETLREIPHIEIIRVHTRIPSHLPERITPELCAVLAKHHPVYINLHFNDPAELTPAAERAVAMLADAGCPLGSHTVLLKDVNDDPETMKALMLKLLKNRIRPYYLFQADQIAGAEHFRTPVSTGIEMIRAIRGWTSGLAVPHFVIDAPGGGGKIPLLPEYVESMTDEEVIVRNYAGERFVYRQAHEPEEATDPALVAAANEMRQRARAKSNGRRIGQKDEPVRGGSGTAGSAQSKTASKPARAKARATQKANGRGASAGRPSAKANGRDEQESEKRRKSPAKGRRAATEEKVEEKVGSTS
jgi:lysine 2,3-aminomutase